MRVASRFALTAIVALMVILGWTAAPAFSKQSGPTMLQTQMASVTGMPSSFDRGSGLVQIPTLIAAKGCEGARAARSYLRSAESALSGVRRESRNLSSALGDVRSALREVEIHWEAKRC